MWSMSNLRMRHMWLSVQAREFINQAPQAKAHMSGARLTNWVRDKKMADNLQTTFESGCICLSLSTINRTYEFSEVTHAITGVYLQQVVLPSVSPFLRYIVTMITESSWTISTHGRDSDGQLARIHKRNLLYIRTSECGYCIFLQENLRIVHIFHL